MRRDNDLDQKNVRTARLHDAMHLLPAVIWMVLIFALSSQQWIFGGTGDPASGSGRDTSWHNWSTRFVWSWSPLSLLGRVAHLAEFVILTALLYWGLRRLTRHHLKAAMLALALSTLYGIIDEIHQSFVPGRTPSVSDLLIDFTGAASAILLIDILAARRGR